MKGKKMSKNVLTMVDYERILGKDLLSSWIGQPVHMWKERNASGNDKFNYGEGTVSKVTTVPNDDIGEKLAVIVRWKKGPPPTTHTEFIRGIMGFYVYPVT